jgi:hypothetical protein
MLFPPDSLWYALQFGWEVGVWRTSWIFDFLLCNADREAHCALNLTVITISGKGLSDLIWR